MVLLFKRLYKIKAKKHDFWVINLEIVIFHDTYTCIMYTHAYIYVCNDGRSWNKTLNDLSRTDKNSRNFWRYIKLSICIRSTCISVLSLLGTQDELSPMAAVSDCTERFLRLPGLSSAALCPACDTQPWAHLNRHSFFSGVLPCPWLSFSFSASLLIKSFFYW